MTTPDTTDPTPDPKNPAPADPSQDSVPVVLKLSLEEAQALWHATNIAADAVKDVDMPSDAPLHGQGARLEALARRLDTAIKQSPTS